MDDLRRDDEGLRGDERQELSQSAFGVHRERGHLPLAPSSVAALLCILLMAPAAAAQVFGPAMPLDANASRDIGDEEQPEIVTDGSGTWITVWDSRDTLDGAIGSESDILFARSTDGGATWTATEALSTDAAIDTGLDSHPHIATDGAGNWVAVWTFKERVWRRTNDTGFSKFRTDGDILVARSSDGGATWTTPVALNADAESDDRRDRIARIATDGHGNWVTVWQSDQRLGDGIDISIARSSDGGVTWTAPTTLNSNAATHSGLDSGPMIASDVAGTLVVAWTSDDPLNDTIGSDRDLLFTRSADGGVTWSVAAPLNTNAEGDAGDDKRPIVAADGAGNWLATWYSTDSLGGTIDSDADVLVARSADDGKTWSAPVAIDSSAANDWKHDVGPVVATDGLGNWVIASSSDDESSLPDEPWGDIENDILVARSGDGGSTWSPFSPLGSNAAGDTGTDQFATIATDAAGVWITVWTSNDPLGDTIGSDVDLLVARSTDLGATWSDPTALNSSATGNIGLNFEPDLAADEEGNWLAVWQSGDSLGGTIGTESDILLARSMDAGATWTAAAALNANAASDSGADSKPRIAIDGAGTWIAVWESEDTLDGTIGSDPDILLARSLDTGATWTAPVALHANAGFDTGTDSNPAIATDAAGTWIAVWESDDPLGGTIEADTDILVSRSTDGGVSWTTPEPVHSNAMTDTEADANPAIAADGAGNWGVVWNSSDSLNGTIEADEDILGVRSTDGGATWTPAVPLDIAAGGDSIPDDNPQIATDGAGVWLVIWHSHRPHADPYAYAQYQDILVTRSTDAGGSWTVPTLLHSVLRENYASFDSHPQISTDEVGTWVAVWESFLPLGSGPPYGSAILSAHSTDEGATWSTPTVLNSNASDFVLRDTKPRVTTNGSGVWVTLWQSSDSVGGSIGEDWDILVATTPGPDNDGDGIPYADEVGSHHTDPFDADTDDDGLDDGTETNETLTDPLVRDSDGDGLDDGDEINEHGTDPVDPDSDADGLDDGSEIATHDTNPLSSDTDGDGLGDGAEVERFGTDPLSGDDAIVINIMPRSERNAADLFRRGILRVAVMGSAEFDVKNVDPTTLAFGPRSAPPTRRRSGLARDVDGDGAPDLVAGFRKRATGIAIGDTEACLTLDTLDGKRMAGCDAVSTLPSCGIGFELSLVLPPLMWGYERRRRRRTPAARER